MKTITKITFKEAVELVKGGDMIPYIKPTPRIHDSGFRMFEVGYCDASGDSRITKKHILGWCDHVQNEQGRLNMDLTRDGYIRMWTSQHHTLCWHPIDYPHALSSMTLDIIPMSLWKK